MANLLLRGALSLGRAEGSIASPAAASTGVQHTNIELARADARARYFKKVVASVESEIQKVADVYARLRPDLADDVPVATVTKRRVPLYPRADLEDDTVCIGNPDLQAMGLRSRSEKVILRRKHEVRAYLRELMAQLDSLKGAANLASLTLERMLAHEEERLRQQWERAIV